MPRFRLDVTGATLEFPPVIYLDALDVEAVCDRARRLMADWPESEWVEISAAGTRRATVQAPARKGPRASG